MTDQPSRTRTEQLRAAALWLRDSALGGLGYAIVLTVATAGWAASFIGLHQFGVEHMHLSNDTAWLVPLTFDGAPAGLSIVVMRASTNGRTALVWRLLVVGFTGLSSWINYMHITDPTGRWVAAFMPPSAVILFEGLMSEARAAAIRRLRELGELSAARPRLHPLRWFFDRTGTVDLYRRYVLGLPLPESMAGTAKDASVPTASGRAASPASRVPAPASRALPAAASTPPASPAVPVPAASPDRQPETATASDGDASRDLAEVAAAYRVLRATTGKHRPSAKQLGDALGLSRSRGQQLREALETHPDYAGEFAPALKSAG